MVQDLDIESKLLVLLLSENVDYEYYLDELQEKFFEKEESRVIYSIIKQKNQLGKDITFSSLLMEVPEDTKSYYRALLVDNTELIINYDSVFKTCIEQIKTKYNRKAIINIVKENLKNTKIDIDTAKENIVNSIDDLAYTDITSTRVKDVIFSYLGDLNAIKSGEKKEKKIYTGFEELDDITNGNKAGELVVIGAENSHGKTSLLLSIIYNLITEADDDYNPNLLFFSLEMTEKEILNRLTSMISKVPAKRFDDKKDFTEDERQRIGKAIVLLSKVNLTIIDDSSLTITQMISKAKKLERKYKGLDAVYVDYFGLIKAYGKTQTELEKNIADGCKRMAKKLGVPVYLLAQLNKEGFSGKPSKRSFKGSGALTDNADLVLGLYRPSINEKTGKRLDIQELQKALVYILKNRRGRTDIIELSFDLDLMKFGEKKPMFIEEVNLGFNN